jgi:hypothetical protein
MLNFNETNTNLQVRNVLHIISQRINLFAGSCKSQELLTPDSLFWSDFLKVACTAKFNYTNPKLTMPEYPQINRLSNHISGFSITDIRFFDFFSRSWLPYKSRKI